MRRLWEWATGWFTTWLIKFSDSEGYDYLSSYRFDPDDFDDAVRPD
jgi:hypothetical protein